MRFLCIFLVAFSIFTSSAFAADVDGEINQSYISVEQTADHKDEFEDELSADNLIDDGTTDTPSDEDLEFSEVEAEQDLKRDAKPLWGKAKKWVKRVVKKVKKIRVKKIIKKSGNSLEKIGKAVAKVGKNVISHFKRRTICYQPYGCFSNRSPWNLIWNVLPQSPRKVGTTFILYNRRNRRGVRLNALAACRSKHRFDKKTIFIIHGWNGGYKKAAYIRQMKDHFLRIGDFNVFGVYWGKGAKRNYFQAAGNTRLVGAQIAYLVNKLNRYKQLSVNNVHLIGFSLGAQIAGFAGRRLREKRKTIGRITGLDPAGPVFARRPRKARLDNTDARFVDVIHTSFLYFLGIKGRCGDIDFYVNGGGAQPGCKGAKAAKCSHARAIQLFMLSIDGRCKYKSYKCSSYTSFRRGRCRRARTTSLGYHVNKRARGKYYLGTKRSYPFCSRGPISDQHPWRPCRHHCFMYYCYGLDVIGKSGAEYDSTNPVNVE